MVEENVFDIPVAPKKKEEVVNTSVENNVTDMVDNTIINASNDAENLSQISNLEPQPLPVTEEAPIAETLPVTNEAVLPTPLVEEQAPVEGVSNPIIEETPEVVPTEENVDESTNTEVLPETPVEDDIKPFADEFMEKEIKPFEESDTMTVEPIAEEPVSVADQTAVETETPQPTDSNETEEVAVVSEEQTTTEQPVTQEHLDETPVTNNISEPLDGPIELSSGLVVPETLDQNYGVIKDIEASEPLNEVIKNEPKVIKKETKDKTKKSKIKAPLIIIVVVLLLAGAGFLGYKFLFGADPVKSLNNEIASIGNKINDIISNHEFTKYINDNDKLAYILRYNDKLNNDFSLTSLGRLNKSEGKMDISMTSSDSNNPNASINTSIVDNAIYLKIGTNNTSYKMTDLYNGFDLSKIFNLKNSNVIDSLTKSINKNLFTNDFTKDTLRVVINGKTKFASKYTANLNNDKINSLIKDFINGLDNNSLIKRLYTEEELNEFYKLEKKAVIEEYITTKGLEKIIIQFRGNNLYIVKTDKGYNIVLNDSELLFTNSADSIKISSKNLDSEKIDAEYIISTVKDNSSITLDCSYNINDETISSLYIRLLPQEIISFNTPNNVVDYSTDEGKNDFDNKLSKQNTGAFDIKKIVGIINNLK